MNLRPPPEPLSSCVDEDLETEVLLRFSPHDKLKPMYRFQHLYLPLVYVLTAFGFFVRDFKVFFTGKSDAFHQYPKFRTGDAIQFWVGKVLFLGMYLVIPMFLPIVCCEASVMSTKCA